MPRKKKFQSEHFDDEGELIELFKPANPTDPHFIEDFLGDWWLLRERHDAQRAVMDGIYEQKKKKHFLRCGRKFAKTSTLIDTAWRFAIENPQSVIYYGFPTIAQAIEVVWEEQRLQRCDSKDDKLKLKYINKINDNTHIITFVNGSYIKLIGTWSEARGRGSQPDLLIFDEIQDCSPSYLSAMDANTASKDSTILMAGTPPPIKNHFHEWEARILADSRGIRHQYSSYANTALPHLKEWLDRKKFELLAAGKEDEWLREYMAEDCFVSASRILPDPKIIDFEEFSKELLYAPNEQKTPVVAIFSHSRYYVLIWAIVESRKSISIVDCQLHKQIFDLSHQKIKNIIEEKCRQYFQFFPIKARKVMFDSSKVLRETFSSFAEARQDLRWQERGIPLLREMMLSEKIVFSNNLADFGVECQRLLMDEKPDEIERNYPMICSLGMLVNEFFEQNKIQIDLDEENIIHKHFADAGIYYPRKKKGKSLFSINF